MEWKLYLLNYQDPQLKMKEY